MSKAGDGTCLNLCACNSAQVWQTCRRGTVWPFPQSLDSVVVEVAIAAAFTSSRWPAHTMVLVVGLRARLRTVLFQTPSSGKHLSHQVPYELVRIGLGQPMQLRSEDFSEFGTILHRLHNSVPHALEIIGQKSLQHRNYSSILARLGRVALPRHGTLSNYHRRDAQSRELCAAAGQLILAVVRTHSRQGSRVVPDLA